MVLSKNKKYSQPIQQKMDTFFRKTPTVNLVIKFMHALHEEEYLDCQDLKNIINYRISENNINKEDIERLIKFVKVYKSEIEIEEDIINNTLIMLYSLNTEFCKVNIF